MSHHKIHILVCKLLCIKEGVKTAKNVVHKQIYIWFLDHEMPKKCAVYEHQPNNIKINKTFKTKSYTRF